MLIKDKFNPIFLQDFEINKNIAEKYKNFYSKDYIQDTIIYGSGGSGKYTFVNSIINTIYEKKIKKNKSTIKLGSKEVRIVSSNYHFEILLDKYNNNFSNLCDLIDLLTESKEINNICVVKIIIIRNLSCCKNDLLLFLKSKIETSGNSFRFFLITDSVSTIESKYRGFFHFINIPNEKKDIITKFYEKNIENFNKKLFNSILKNTSNLNVILTEYELGLLNKSKSFIDLKFTKIYNLIKDSKKNPDNIIKIRDEIYEINIKNLDFQIILKRLLKELINDKNIPDDKKHEIINEFSTYSVRIVTCYKEQIHYEALLSRLIYIYHK